MKKTHLFLNLSKDSGGSKGSSNSKVEDPKKPKKKHGGFSGSPTNIRETPKIDISDPVPVALPCKSQPDARLALSVLPITHQPKKRCTQLFLENTALVAPVEGGWKSKCRWVYSSNSAAVKQKPKTRELMRKVYDEPNNDPTPPMRVKSLRVSVPVTDPEDEDSEEGCWKRCVTRVFGVKEKFSRIWNLLKEKKGEWDAWNPNKTHPIVACIDESKLAGLKETIKPNRGICYRIFWLVIFCVALAVGTKLSYNEYKFQEESPVLHAFDTKEIGVNKLPSPTVANCPSAAFKESSVSQAIDGNNKNVASGHTKLNLKPSDHSKLLYFMNHACEPKTIHSSRYGQGHVKPFQRVDFEKNLEGKPKNDPTDKILTEHIIPFMKKASRTCGEMMKYCSWNTKSDSENSCKDFKPSFETTGGCCVFNKLPDSAMYKGKQSWKSLWSNDEGYEKSKWKNWTLHNHLRHLNDPNTGEVLAGPLRQADGGWPWGLSFLVIMDEEDSECPQFDSSGTRITISVPGVDVDVERENVLIPPNHEVFIRIYPEVTVADDDLITVPYKVRGCYMDQERNLTHYKMYTQENCHRECIAEFILKRCGCVLLSFPNSADQTVCDPQEFECVRQAEAEVVLGAEHLKTCSHCLPTCSHMTLRLETTMTPFSQRHITEIADKSGNKSSSLVHTFYGPRSITAKVRKLRHSKYEVYNEIGSIYETTNDMNLMGYTRILVGLTLFISTYVSYRYFRYLRPFCCCCLLCRKLFVRIFGLKRSLTVHPTRKTQRSQADTTDQESGGRTNNETSLTDTGHEFPRSTNFDVFLLDSSHIVLPMEPHSSET